jgi:hypothetical protein
MCRSQVSRRHVQETEEGACAGVGRGRKRERQHVEETGQQRMRLLSRVFQVAGGAGRGMVPRLQRGLLPLQLLCGLWLAGCVPAPAAAAVLLTVEDPKDAKE